ncbi:ABC transporter permease [Lederbergia lenta]|uniref:ABC transporter permease n=1 Tax=Lederbergia lenta TaxID=1467 RepID=UPI00203E76CC|nr:ABC transporter permease subunit [Lederbergia lenta]MCM3112594.1 ABC transporter permease [Lederbergia lenta]
MNELMISEWERLWKRKVTWLMVAVLPIMAFASAKYYQKQNNSITSELPQYAVLGNFPVLGLSEMLMTIFNMVVLVIAAIIITEEYRSGQLRMVLIRTYSFQQIIIAKFTVLLSFIFLYLTAYFIICYGIGYAMFSHPETYPQFYYEDQVTNIEGLIYNLKFYGLAFLTLIAMSSVVFFIATISHSTTTTLGVGVGFLFISFSYPNIVNMLQLLLKNEIVMKIIFTSIPMIQWEGLTMMLAKSSSLLGWMFLMLLGYILLFNLLTFIVIKKRNIFL